MNTVKVEFRIGNCLDVLPTLDENSFDSCVTDPPYHLTSIVKRFGKNGSAPAQFGTDGAYVRASSGFMGKQWDGGDVAFCPETWAAVYRVLKPGAHLLAFGGTRTYHRMACAIEDAGFEIRDCIQWIYGSGFPKSHDVSKGIDRAAGAEREVVGSKFGQPGYRTGTTGNNEIYGDGIANGDAKCAVTAPATDTARQWEGWGTALKPCLEIVCMARKPLSEKTVAANVLRWGTGAINVDACRVGTESTRRMTGASPLNPDAGWNNNSMGNILGGSDSGRWPGNLIHDGSDEVVARFPDVHGAGASCDGTAGANSENWEGNIFKHGGVGLRHGDEGSAARFFYQVKQDEPSWADRECNNAHVNNAGECLNLQSEAAASVLSDAVAMSAGRLMLQKQSYRGQSMTVTANELKIICASVTEIIQNLERRYLLGFPHENIMAKLPGVRCAAIPKQTGITTIIIDRWTLGPYVELVTFDIIETNAEVGELACASRTFYTAKADSDDRIGSKHPTVKPLDLMQYLVRLITPKGGIVLDPFAGTGTTGEAAFREGMRAVLIEREAEYAKDIERRIAMCMAGPVERSNATMKAKQDGKPRDDGPLFSGEWDDMWSRSFDRPDLV